MTFERGEPQDYEVTWVNGHIDHVLAHQVTWPANADFLSAFHGNTPRPARVHFHAEVAGHWMLLLDALESEIRSIRNLTQLKEELN